MGERMARTVFHLFGLHLLDRYAERDFVNLTNDSLHLRKLARFFLYTHSCDVMLMRWRADVDNELILFGGALQIRLPRFQLLEKCRRK